MLCFVPEDADAFSLFGGYLPPELSAWPGPCLGTIPSLAEQWLSFSTDSAFRYLPARFYADSHCCLCPRHGTYALYLLPWCVFGIEASFAQAKPEQRACSGGSSLFLKLSFPSPVSFHLTFFPCCEAVFSPPSLSDFSPIQVS